MNQQSDAGFAVPDNLEPVRAPADAAGSKWRVLVAVCLSGIAFPLAFTGPAVATPAISADLAGSVEALSWIVNAFVLSFGSCIMFAGTLADRYGRKRLYALGVTCFALASLALMGAPSVLWLDLLRALQGAAAALALSAGAAALAQEFEGHERTRAFSLLGTTFGAGLAFGPVLAGVLVDAFGWRAIFLGVAVVDLAALVFGVPRMRETRDPEAAGLDWPGATSFTAALVALTVAVMEGPSLGWASAPVLTLLGATVVAGLVFVAVERRAARPMLDLSLFVYGRFIGVQFLPIATAFCFVVLLVVLPMRFINVEHFSTSLTGALMMVLSAPLLLLPVAVAALTRRYAPGTLCAAGLVLASAGLVWLGRVPVGGGALGFVVPLLIVGVGTSASWGLMDGLSVSVVPKERAGMATGIFSTTRVAGEGIIMAAAGGAMTALVQAGLSGSMAGAAGASTAAAAHRVALGYLAQAAQDLPGIAPQALQLVYSASFGSLLLGLAACTCVSGAMVLVSLVKGAPAADGASPARPGPAPGDDRAALER